MTLSDPYFRVETLAFTPNPQQVVYAAMHQDYSEGFVYDGEEYFPDEIRAGQLCIKHLLNGGRGHYGPIEHPAITLNCGWFPHSVMQQARTHRVAVSFDVQSGRYTGQRVCQVASGQRNLEEVFYLRPVGTYADRKGKKYEYTLGERNYDLSICYDAAQRYTKLIGLGYAEEHARGILPFDIRQHFVVSFNLRSVLHFLDLRSKLDAQPEIQALCDLIWPHVGAWAPEIAGWYETNRLHKARLAP